MGGFGLLNEHPRMRILELGRRLVMWKVVIWEPCVVGGPGTARIEFWVLEEGAKSLLKEKGNTVKLPFPMYWNRGENREPKRYRVWAGGSGLPRALRHWEKEA